MSDTEALTAQFSSFQDTFDNINSLISTKGMLAPETLGAIKSGLYTTLGIRLPKVLDKGVNAYFITDLVTRAVNKGKGISAVKDDPEARLVLADKMNGWATSIENSMGLQGGPLSKFVRSLFKTTEEELEQNREKTLEDAAKAQAELEKETGRKGEQALKPAAAGVELEIDGKKFKAGSVEELEKMVALAEKIKGVVAASPITLEEAPPEAALESKVAVTKGAEKTASPEGAGGKPPGKRVAAVGAS